MSHRYDMKGLQDGLRAARGFGNLREALLCEIGLAIVERLEAIQLRLGEMKEQTQLGPIGEQLHRIDQRLRTIEYNSKL